MNQKLSNINYGNKMRHVSLIGAKSYLPEKIVHNDFFYCDEVDEDKIPGMFNGVKTRRHISKHETPDYMATIAIEELINNLNLNRNNDIQMLITHTAMSDYVFT